VRDSPFALFAVASLRDDIIGREKMISLPPLLTRISDYVAWHALATPDAVALVVDGREKNYAELNAEIDGLAKALLAAGVRKGDRVATLQAPHPDYVTTWLATASIGAIWVGLNPRYQTAELAYVIEDAAPKILITRTQIGKRNYEAELIALRDTSPELEQVIAFDGDPPVDGVMTMSAFLKAGESISDADLNTARAECGGCDPCVIVYTSGSTGKPKGALLHHEGIASFALEQNKVWPVNPHRNLNFLPINHIGCVCDITAPCLVAGGTLFFMEQFDPSAATKLIELEKLTLWGSVPSVFGLQMATAEFATTDMSSLQLILWEGAMMPADMITELLKIGPPMATNYGMTESVSGITVQEPSRDAALLSSTCGGAFPGVDIRLIDANGHEVPDGEPGEVIFKSRYMFLGYWRRPEATAASFTADGYFRSGDLATRHPDGSYRIIGRIKDMYKSGGYNVYPREVEDLLEAHPAIALAAVVAKDDTVWQEVGVAYVTPSSAVTTEELATWCRQRLANYKVPKIIVIEPDMPLLPIGKVDKVTLKRRAAELED
jgi:acyl-CoA synthetase (AMP-forming)/AMP-acid ligase II